MQPGTYVENINYNGKNITVASLFLTTQDTSYISQTIIDGNQNGSVVTFDSGEDSTAILSGFKVTNGYDNAGGGIRCCASSPCINNLIVINNSADWGGGIYFQDSNASLTNMIISSNSVLHSGGGIDIYTASPNFINVSIINNSAYNFGGGIYFELQSNSNLSYVLIADNTAFIGGGIRCWGSTPTITNSSIISNNSDFGGGLSCNDSNPHFENSIFWNDFPEEIFFEDGSQNTITISYSDIQGGEAGIEINNNGIVNWQEGNLNADPLFLDAANGDYHLTENSPCIDAGDPNSPFDPDGTISDMGAFYYDQTNGIENYELQTANFKLANYPNPFNPTTTISFSVTQNSDFVNLEIFNIKGQRVKTLDCSNSFAATSKKLTHSIVWNGDDENGKPVCSGVYLYKLNVNGKTEAVRKCLLMK